MISKRLRFIEPQPQSTTKRKEEKEMTKIYNDTEFTTAFFKGLEWGEGKTYFIKEGNTVTIYTARLHGKVFTKEVWADGVVIYNA